MIFKSIRWRFQIWYGIILIGVLTAFGFTSYQLERGRQFRHIDGELQRRVNGLIGVVHQPQGRPRLLEERPFDRPPLRENRRPIDRPFAEGGPENLPRLPTEFHVPPQLAGLFDESDTNGFYYLVWLRNGRELARSANAPQLVPPPARMPTSGPQPPRMRGMFREAFIITPPGEIVLAGRSIGPELGELRLAAGRLVLVGAGVLLLGLAGGWWIATRAIRPIEAISGTAVKIAAGDLSQRISATDADNELGRLAGVLNSTFARLEAAFAQQARFTADAAHELHTPVAVMLTQTQSALARERPGAEYRETLEACQRAAQRMRRLTESLLQLARLDAGQETMKRLQFDLSTIVRECVELIHPLAKERGISLHCDSPSLECVGDPERLAQVITNLLANAIQYNKENGEVRATTTSVDHTAVLTVSDTGPGIRAEDLPRVFDRFFRADESRAGSTGHTGLGLAISKAIVEAHGGTIEVSSAPGLGTTFTMRLPLPSKHAP